MPVPKFMLAAATITMLVTAGAAAAQAVGRPQRTKPVPMGLAQAFARDVPGLLNAIMRTEGTPSRLQDLPASP